MPDLLVVDSATFAFLCGLGSDAVRYQQSEKVTFGPTMANICGMNVLNDARMDLLIDGFSDEDASVAATEYREMYLLSSKEIRWRHTGVSEGTRPALVDVPGAPGIQQMQYYFEACHWNRAPRHHGRIFNHTGVTF